MKRIAVTLVVLLVTLFTCVGVTSSTPYDAWYDFDDDGDIDIYDIVDIAGRYGTTGIPINKTELLLELQERVDLLNATVMALQGGYVAETGEFDGVVNADMVEDSGANTVINFQTPFTSVEKPEMVISVVLKQAANGLTEGSAIKVVEDIKGATGFWTGFDLTVSKYSDGSSISDSTKVYVTWIAVGTESTSTTQPNHCAETAVHYTTQFWTPPPASLNHNQIKLDFPLTFTNASDVELSASGIVVTGTCAGSPLRITAVNITTTYAILTLQGWNGSSWTNLGAGDEVEINYVVIEN